jgi:hypothetical protein
VTSADAQTLKLALSNKAQMEKLAAENVVLHAQGVLGAYETDDADDIGVPDEAETGVIFTRRPCR